MKLKLSSTVSLSLDLSGQASISLWTQTGRIHCENTGAVTVVTRATVGEEETLVVEQTQSVGGVLEADTLIDLSGQEPLVCLILNQQPIKVRRTERRVERGRHTQTGEDQTLDGLTWNLNVENNRICNRMTP